MVKRIIIVGATSGIGKELALLYAKTDANIGIIGRREEKLIEVYETYPLKYIYKKCDITCIAEVSICLNKLINELGGLDLIILSSGTGFLNPTLKYEIEEPTLFTNIIGFTYITDYSLNVFEQQGYGHLCVISSVGGLRGSGDAPAYNASKAYQINYIEGIRQRITKLKIPIFITDIRPGFVNTAMAKGEGLFWVCPVQKASLQIFKAITKKRKIVYISKRWKLIAWILKIIPSALYCRI